MTDIESVNPGDKTTSCAVSKTVVNMRDVQLAGGMKLTKWCATVGISRTKCWRLRRSGKLPVVVRYGTAYITAETIKQFFTNDGSMPRTPCRAKVN